MGLIGLFLVSTAAYADVPVLTVDDGNKAVRMVAADAQRDVWDLEPTRLTDRLPAGGMVSIGKDQPKRCNQLPATNDTLKQIISQAEALIEKEDYETAKPDLERGVKSLPCMTELVKRDVASRLYLLLGATAMKTNDTVLVLDALASSLRFNPDTVWDMRLGAEGQDWMEDASMIAGGEETGPVYLGPGTRHLTELYVDSHKVAVQDGKVDVPFGLHLIQATDPNVRSVEARITDQGTVLIFAEKIDDKLVTRATEEDTHEELGTLIKGIFPDQEEAFIWTGDQTIKWPGFEPLAPSATTRSSTNAAKGQRMLVAGAVLAGFGAATLGSSFGVWAPGADTKGGTPVDTTRNENLAAAGAGLRTAGLVGLGAGVVTMGISFTMGGGK